MKLLVVVTPPSIYHEGCLPPHVSHHNALSSPFPDTRMLSHFPKVLHRPERPSICSPSINPPLTAFSSAPPPWRTVQRQGAFRSIYVRVPACCIGGTVGGGGFPPPKRPRCTGHAGAENGPAFSSSSQLVPGIPHPGSSAGLP